MNNSKYWLAFSSLEKVSSIFTQRLYEYFSDIEVAWGADISELVKVPHITKKQLENYLEEKKNINPDKCLDYIANSGFDFVNYDSPEYPPLLKQIYNPPMTLFLAGDLTRCNLDKTLAVVGSRKASDNSKEILKQIIAEFSNTDVCIVSGLAMGIDTTAHTAAINSNISTIAVLGGGLNHIYPASNKQLYQKIKDKNGVVISEYWPTFEPIAWRFPHRNRIVSGLSRGTLVAEAALKSGALITAKLATEQNRELMCIPGLVSNPNTAGVHKLLKEGASLVTSADDILNILNWEIKHDTTQETINKVDNVNNISEKEREILDLISKDSLTFDEIISKIGLNIADLMVILTNLEIRGLIKQTNGERYVSLVVF